jgi:hypothetical protein
MRPCKGSFHALVLYDVAEELDLEILRASLGTGPPARKPEFKLPAPVYVRFENPPVVENSEPVCLSTGEAFTGRLQYFDYGVVSLELELQFEADWEELIQLASRWIEAPDLERCAMQVVRKRMADLNSAVRRVYPEWLDEVYYAVHLREVGDPAGRRLTAAELVSQHGRAITQIVRGEVNPLSQAEERELLSSSVSYYPTDLLVVGWMTALVYDTDEGAAPTIQLLEYANTQLLEYRRYDEVLTRVLKRAYDSLDRTRGLFSSWKLASEAKRFNRLRLEITELAERTDNAIKFLSDMFYARVYQLASSKIGVNDYRRIVDDKQGIAREFYDFMVGEFRDARTFVLELMANNRAVIPFRRARFVRGGDKDSQKRTGA